MIIFTYQLGGIMKELDSKLIEDANMISFSGRTGDMFNEDYKNACKIIEQLGDDSLYDDAYKLFTKALEANASWVSPIVAGPSKYKQNDKKLDRIIHINQDIADFIDELNEKLEVKKKRDAGVSEHDEFVQKKIKEAIATIRFVGDLNKPLCYETILELADIDIEAFKKLYRTYDKVYGISKRSKVYKRYKLSV